MHTSLSRRICAGPGTSSSALARCPMCFGFRCFEAVSCRGLLAKLLPYPLCAGSCQLLAAPLLIGSLSSFQPNSCLSHAMEGQDIEHNSVADLHVAISYDKDSDFVVVDNKMYDCSTGYAGVAVSDQSIGSVECAASAAQSSALQSVRKHPSLLSRPVFLWACPECHHEYRVCVCVCVCMRSCVCVCVCVCVCLLHYAL